MAYKKYFYKMGKKFGPYYYHNYRDKKGNIKKKYLGKKNPDMHKLILRILIALIIVVIIFISIITYNLLIKNRDLSYFSCLSSEKPENKIIWTVIIIILIILILIIMLFLIVHLFKIMFSKSIIDKKR